MRILYFIIYCFSLHANLEQIFTQIYEMGTWNESGFSLNGSHISYTKKYVDFLQDFMKENQIRSVVDIGCGDWAFSKYVNWEGIDYLGIDIVKFVIERNQRLFARHSIVFVQGNALEMELPEADLLICKDVFQHLSNADIKKMLKKFAKFKHCLITDYVDYRTMTSLNNDIVSGCCHHVDLTKPPFNVKGKKIFSFQALMYPKQTIHILQKDLIRE